MILGAACASSWWYQGITGNADVKAASTALTAAVIMWVAWETIVAWSKEA